MKRRIVVSLVVGLVVLLCAGLIGFNFLRDFGIKTFFANMAANPPPQTIAATEVKARTWTPGIPAIGTARATFGVELAAQIGGVVRQFNIVPNKTFK
jgi:membrane fusion protein (multidrug efflux system)